MESDDGKRIPENKFTNSGYGASNNKIQTAGRISASSAMEQFPPLNGDGENPEDSEDEEEEDTEPNLRYTKLTGSLSTVYRNGDSSSAFITAGDKLVIGTHNGSMHIFSLPSFEPLRVYQAHSASVTAISISPIRSFSRGPKTEESSKPSLAASSNPNTPSKKGSGIAPVQSPKSPRQLPVPATPSNQIYIASASVDGKVCVSSLIDSKDVTLRNYARPIQAVALSPDFKNDRTYLCGGLAGELIVTVGGRMGVSENANTNSTAAAASGWLGSIGLSSNTGKDTVVHSGDGAIKIIKWSLSGRYFVWVDEMGVNIMRSGLHLESSESDYAWKRINLIDRPHRRTWEDMAGVWQARAEWVDEQSVEMPEEQIALVSNRVADPFITNEKVSTPKPSPAKLKPKKKTRQTEKVLVGWGDMIWILQVSSEAGEATVKSRSSAGHVECLQTLKLDDCIISGLTLYTPSLLLVLAYSTYEDDKKAVSPVGEGTPRRGIRRRQNGKPPEIRLVEIASGDYIETDSLTVKNFESMTATDYHMSTIFVPPIQNTASSVPVQRGTFGSIGGGLWDMGASATRLFNSGASVLSSSSSAEKVSWSSPANTNQTSTASSLKESHIPLMKPGLKIFLQSPYDCVLVTKRDLSDRMTWLLEHEEYRQAWDLAVSNPEVISPQTDADSRPSTPSRGDQSMVDFFDDETISQSSSSNTKAIHSAIEKEKRRIGELWLEQLIAADDWQSAGATTSKVLGTSQRWEHWIKRFTRENKYDEIVPYIPTKRLRPALPSAIYEDIFDHYIATNTAQLQDLLDRWDPAMFNVPNVTSAIEAKLEDRDAERDLPQLLEALANVYLADSRPKDAFRCYIRVQNADAALELVREYQLINSISDDIYAFILLRISKQKLATAPLEELDNLSSEPIKILLDGTKQGLISAKNVVDQLRDEPSSLPFQFFYFRSLWNNQGSTTSRKPTIPRQRMKPPSSDNSTNSPLRIALDEHADHIISLFAEYSPSLLLPFFKSSTTYSFEQASLICESRGYIPELVYLLSVTGQAKRALFLIIDSLDDISQAIAFAKEFDDPELWEDLLAYSMDKPPFIRVLLEEVGTAEGVDAVELVRRIPEGVVIEGLKQGLGRILNDFECQWSICEGAARVLRSEVAAGLETLTVSRKHGIIFDVLDDVDRRGSNGTFGEHTNSNNNSNNTHKTKPLSGRCSICADGYNDTEDDFLLGFPCKHVFHLACFLDEIITTDPTKRVRIERIRTQLMDETQIHEEEPVSPKASVATKVTHAQLIESVIGDRACPRCMDHEQGSPSKDD